MNTNTVRERTYNAIPGYAEAVLRAENGRTQLRTRNEGKQFDSAYAAMVARIEELLDNGEDIPKNIADAVVVAETNDRALALRAQAITQTTPNPRAFRETLFITGAEPATAHLAKELATLVTDVQNLAPALTGVTDPAGAIRSGAKAVDAWQQLTTHLDTYEDIRKVQWEILLANITDPRSDTIGRIALIRESIDAIPYWVQRRAESANLSTSDTEEATAYRDWLRSATADWTVLEDPATAWWPTLNREHHLLHLCTKLHPWIPTPSTFDKALALAGTATSPGTQDIPTAQEVARHQYYELTQIDAGIDTTPHRPTAHGGRGQAKYDAALARAKGEADARIRDRERFPPRPIGGW